MKKMFKVVLGVWLVGGMISIKAAQTIPLSFDRLYPQTLFGVAREQCIRAWGSLDTLLGNSQRDSRSTLLLDAALGQLVFAKDCVKKIDSQKIPLSSEDLIEFSRVVGTVVDRSEHLSDSENADKVSLLRKVLTRLRECCERIMDRIYDI